MILPLTLSPVAGRRLDYTIYIISVGIGGTDWRDLKQPSLCCHFNHMFHAQPSACCVFFAPIDIQQALIIQDTQCSCRFILATKALQSSFEINIHIASQMQQDTYHIHTRYTHACGVCGLFSWSMAAGLLAFWSRQFALIYSVCYNQSWTFSLSASHHFSFLSASVAGGVCRPRSEAPCTYTFLW